MSPIPEFFVSVSIERAMESDFAVESPNTEPVPCVFCISAADTPPPAPPPLKAPPRTAAIATAAAAAPHGPIADMKDMKTPGILAVFRTASPPTTAVVSTTWPATTPAADAVETNRLVYSLSAMLAIWMRRISFSRPSMIL